MQAHGFLLPLNVASCIIEMIEEPDRCGSFIRRDNSLDGRMAGKVDRLASHEMDEEIPEQDSCPGVAILPLNGNIQAKSG